MNSYFLGTKSKKLKTMSDENDNIIQTRTFKTTSYSKKKKIYIYIYTHIKKKNNLRCKGQYIYKRNGKIQNDNN